jgi:preprotein translocase subunit SecE
MITIINYIKNSYEELRNNVSWTPRVELQDLVLVVLVFSILFSLAIWGADTILSRIVKIYLNIING